MENEPIAYVGGERTVDELVSDEQSTLALLDATMMALTIKERRLYTSLIKDVVSVEADINQLATDDFKRRGELESMRLARARFVSRFWGENEKRKAVSDERAPLIERLIDVRTALREQSYYLP